MSVVLTDLLRRAGDWLVEPPADRLETDLLTVPGTADLPRRPPQIVAPPRRYPLVAVVGLARRCGATTLARALGAELASRTFGAAVVASPQAPAVVALGGSPSAARLAETMGWLRTVRVAGRLCLTVYDDVAGLASVTREAAPALIEVEPGVAAVEAAPLVDRVVLVAPPSLDSRLVAAVAETVEAVATEPLVAVNRCGDHAPWLSAADVLVPESRVGARLALSGREPRGGLGRSVQQLADLCVGE